MSGSFLVLKQAMGVTGLAGPQPSWDEVMGELWPIISAPLSLASEQLLLDIIHHNGDLCVIETDELPHSLSPDEMLKSLAVQALARWTKLTYLTALQRLELTVSSAALKDVIRAVIQTTLTSCPETFESDVIYEEEPEVDEVDEGLMWSVSTYPIPTLKPKPLTRRRVARPVRHFGNLTFIDRKRAKRERRKEEFEFAQSSRRS